MAGTWQMPIDVDGVPIGHTQSEVNSLMTQTGSAHSLSTTEELDPNSIAQMEERKDVRSPAFVSIGNGVFPQSHEGSKLTIHCVSNNFGTD